ncbi:MAG: hypothetical protein H0V73_03695 [Chloroflexi bacterium]|nr:hypothetical protein [Chloroflexota bacterium]
MIALRRRAAGPLVSFLAIGLAVLTAGCGSGAQASPRPSSSALAPSPLVPSITAVPGGPSPVVGVSVGPPTTNVTGFGPIFDSLPASFPKLPGQEPATTGAGATSGSFAVNMTADDAALAMAAALTNQGWTADVSSALEDGTVVLDATAALPGCKAEVRFTPLSGTIIMSVLYGASCPFG